MKMTPDEMLVIIDRVIPELERVRDALEQQAPHPFKRGEIWFETLASFGGACAAVGHARDDVQRLANAIS